MHAKPAAPERFDVSRQLVERRNPRVEVVEDVVPGRAFIERCDRDDRPADDDPGDDLLRLSGRLDRRRN